MKIRFTYENITYKLQMYKNDENFYRLSLLNGDKCRKGKCKDILRAFGYLNYENEGFPSYKLGRVLYDAIYRDHIIPYVDIENNLDENNVTPNNVDTSTTINEEEVEEVPNRNANSDHVPGEWPNMPKCAYKTHRHSSLSPRAFYNKVYELLVEKYRNLMNDKLHRNLNLETAKEELNKYFELTDYRDDWVYKSRLQLNENSVDYLFAQFVYHSQNAPFTGLIDFYKNYRIYQDTFNNFEVSSFLNDCNNYPESVKTRIVNVLAGDYRFDQDKINKCFVLYRNMVSYLNGHTREEIINDLYSHKDDNDLTSVPNYLISRVGEKLGINIALACDFVKEIDIRFNYLFKPDKHVLHFFDNYVGTHWTLDPKNALDIGVYLVNRINQDGGERITGYKFDRMIYLLGSGFFFLDEYFRQSKRTAPREKWERILPQINPEN